MIKNILYLFVLIFVLFEMLLNSSAIINSVSFSFNLCINNLFPSLFPFMILSNILIEYGFVIICSELFKPIMNKVFKANEKGARSWRNRSNPRGTVGSKNDRVGFS